MTIFIRTRSAMAVAGLFALMASQGAHADTFVQTYELPGVKNTTTTFSGGTGVETFDTRSTGTGGFVSNFGGSTITGTYSNSLRVDPANQYGSANGIGNHAVTFSSAGYSIALDTPVNYFGYWLSALDTGNVVEFYSGTTLVGSLGAAAVLSSIGGNATYFGNPNGQFAGMNSTQPYAFVNFYNTNGTFDRIVFREEPSFGGYESDNHTIGMYRDITGVPVVPEPSTYALMAAGLGAVAFAARRRRQR
ncbi:PEP-CTERM sorting domain-containing protein [Pelomonas sp. Root1217]|uniref:Npun_F0296 family exosortase-dependent surface protein n=1 Tax=Pelomonas sp. Root1217 TaxID=1736430 RepID=UPI00070EEE9E|nr:PEP-CTERM sorting domain-containing protein [Pelomonas sp. Root1217]